MKAYDNESLLLDENHEDRKLCSNTCIKKTPRALLFSITGALIGMLIGLCFGLLIEDVGTDHNHTTRCVQHEERLTLISFIVALFGAFVSCCYGFYLPL